MLLGLGIPLPLAMASPYTCRNITTSASVASWEHRVALMSQQFLAVELSIREYIRTVVKESYAVFKQHFLGLYLIYHRVLKGIHLQSLPTEIFNKANGRLFISITSCRSFLKNRIINQLFERGSIGCNMHLKPDPIHAVTIIFLQIQR